MTNIYKKYINQTIGSTREDLHGERMSKEFLEKIAADWGRRKPLHQHHDMSKETIGYMENFRVVPDEECDGEWCLKADIYITSDNVDEAMRGFSYSYIEVVWGNKKNYKHAIYLPYPHYNDESFITELLSSSEDLAVGKLIQKQLEPLTIGLITTSIAFLLGPEWANTYNKHVRPRIKSLFSYIPKLKKKNISPEFYQHVQGLKGEVFQVHYIPDRSKEIESLNDEYIYEGLKLVDKFINEDAKSRSIGVKRIKLYFDSMSSAYKLFHVEYIDGTDLHIA
jgi:hypothetical protein